MGSRLRIATIALGALFTLQSVGWIAQPARAAAALGMPLLDGVGRSTQVGDFAAFFLTIGLMALIGARRGYAKVLVVPAAMLAAAALGRTLAWALQDAAFAALFIAIELAAAAVLFTASRRLEA